MRSATLIDVGSLVALTSGGEYVTGDQNKVLTPSSFAFSSQGIKWLKQRPANCRGEYCSVRPGERQRCP